MQITQPVAASGQAAVDRARRALVEELRAAGMITSAAVEQAFLAVPRHAFVPEGTPLQDTYHVDRSVAVKRDAHGVIVSSVSATYIQARMIEQAELQRGMRVLEIGSGGYNAALLAEVVGPEGHVVSVDIDPDVTDRASRLLEANGYAGRVRVVLADAEHEVPGEDAFDAVLVTAGAWDVAPAWLRQLAPGGGRRLRRPRSPTPPHHAHPPRRTAPSANAGGSSRRPRHGCHAADHAHASRRCRRPRRAKPPCLDMTTRDDYSRAYVRSADRVKTRDYAIDVVPPIRCTGCGISV